MKKKGFILDDEYDDRIMCVMKQQLCTHDTINMDMFKYDGKEYWNPIEQGKNIWIVWSIWTGSKSINSWCNALARNARTMGNEIIDIRRTGGASPAAIQRDEFEYNKKRKKKKRVWKKWYKYKGMFISRGLYRMDRWCNCIICSWRELKTMHHSKLITSVSDIETINEFVLHTNSTNIGLYLNIVATQKIK